MNDAQNNILTEEYLKKAESLMISQSRRDFKLNFFMKFFPLIEDYEDYHVILRDDIKGIEALKYYSWIGLSSHLPKDVMGYAVKEERGKIC